MKYWLNTKGFPIGSDPKRLDRIGWSNSEEILIRPPKKSDSRPDWQSVDSVET
jgi:hypothetical protein